MQPDLFRHVAVAGALIQSLPVIAGLLCASAVALFFLPKAKHLAWARRVEAFLSRHVVLRNGIQFVKEFARRPKVALIAVAISAVSYGFNFLSGYLIGLSLNIPVTFSQIIIVLAVVYSITSLPISVGGHGIREITIIALFLALGIIDETHTETALAFSLLLFAVQLFWSIIGGLYYVMHKTDIEAGSLNLSRSAGG